MAVVVTAKSGNDLAYVWVNQPQQDAGRELDRPGGYYLDAADREAPGRWFGPGAEALGLAAGTEVKREAYNAVYRQVHPQTGARLGRPPGGYAKYEAILASLRAAEPHATQARVRELEREAARAARVAYPYTDVTVSFSKSISVVHASIRENYRRARQAGDAAAQAYWNGRELAFQECLQEGNRAALEYAQQWAGVTRTGHHGARVDGQEAGRFEDAGLIVSSWLQGTSRDGDPQDHIHNQIARLVITFADGKPRAKDTLALRAALPAMQGIASLRTEAALTREFGVSWVARADGRGYEIAGVPQQVMDEFSSRTISIKAELPAAIAAWSARHGGAQPSQAQLLYIQNVATLASRQAKTDGDIDWDACAQKWDAQAGGILAELAPAVSNMRGPGGGAAARGEPDSPGRPSAEALAGAARDALALVQQARPAWSRADLIRVLSACMPAETRRLDPGGACRLLEDLADDVLASRFGDVVCLSAPEFLSLPASLRRGPDARSIYERPGHARYATRGQLATETRIVSLAQRACVPLLDRGRAADLLGASAADLEAALAARRADAGARLTRTGLRLDQAAALYHALTCAQRASVLTGPAGSGKSFCLAAAARACQDAGVPQIWGIACSQTATNVLADAAEARGVTMTAVNSAQFLGDLPGQPGARGELPVAPGAVIMIDEASMLPLDHLARILEVATRRSARVIITGDQEQLAAVEGGGAMRLLAQRLGFAQLAEPVRFTHSWERDASLRLRAGDATVLDDYDDHGRIRGCPAEQMMDDAASACTASILEGRHVLMIASDWNRCRELSRRVRDDLIHLGRVSAGPAARIAEDAECSAGDLVICRQNDHQAGLANGDICRVESVAGGQLELRKVTGRDPDTGAALFSPHTITSGNNRFFDLGYAITGHGAQGATASRGVAVITGAEDRQWLYVAMTRGADENVAYVCTQPNLADAKPGTRPAPELARRERIERERAGLPPENDEPADEQDGREPVACLADVLARDGAAVTALEVQASSLANADHLGLLHAIWEGETAGPRHAAYRRMLAEVLPGHPHAGGSYQAEWLWRSLRQAELCGLDARQVLSDAVHARDLAGARDVASVLYARVQNRITGMTPQQAQRWSRQVPPTSDPQRAQFLTELAGAMDARRNRIGEFAASSQPEWATRALGNVPADPLQRLDWEHKAAQVGSYREIYGIESEQDLLGPEPTSGSPDRRATWQAACQAIGSPGTENLSRLRDAQLHLRRNIFRQETSWAPRYTARELRAARIMMRDAALQAVRAEAEAQAAHRRHDAGTAARHERLAASARALADRYRAAEPELVRATQDYDEWSALTEGSRRAAVTADAELRRRYPGRPLEPLKSAEPEPVTEDERQDLAQLPQGLAEACQPPAWITELAAAQRAFREKADERTAVMIPAEDHEWPPEGEAFPALLPRERDAILQPPRPQMPAAIPVLQHAADREAGQ